MNFSKKIILVLLTISFFPLISGTFLFYFIFNFYLKGVITSNLIETAKILSAHVEEFLSSALESLNILIQNPIISSPQTSLDEKIAELEKIKKYYPKFQDISIVDPRGNTLYSTSFQFSGEWKSNAWFRESKEKKEIVISDIYALFSPKEPFLAFFVPILTEEKEISFILAVQLNMEKFLNIFHFLPENSILINDKGRILGSSDRELLFEKISQDYPLETTFTKSSEKVEFTFNNKIKVIGAYSLVNFEKFSFTSSPRKWQVIVFQRKDEVFKINRFLRNQILLISTILFFLIMIFSFILSYQIVSPIRELILATKKIREGNFEGSIKIQRQDEFGELINSFNKMIEKVRESRELLEKEKNILEVKVKERTRELEELTKRQEEMIRERTKELQEKIEELENFRKIAVGREVKMIELKEEIEKLKRELQQFKKS